MSGVAVHLSGLTRRFGTMTALDNLDLEVAPGELLALLGPSGCGKTTALRLLGGFDRPDTGRVLVNGRDVSNVPGKPPRHGDGLPGLQPVSKYGRAAQRRVRPEDAQSQRGDAPRARGGDARPRRARRPHRALSAPDCPGVSSSASHSPARSQSSPASCCSTSHSPRLMPACATSCAPRSAVSSSDSGSTTLSVTHDQAEALSMADRVGVMYGGQLEQLGTPQETRPAGYPVRRRVRRDDESRRRAAYSPTDVSKCSAVSLASIGGLAIMGSAVSGERPRASLRHSKSSRGRPRRGPWSPSERSSDQSPAARNARRFDGSVGRRPEPARPTGAGRPRQGARDRRRRTRRRRRSARGRSCGARATGGRGSPSVDRHLGLASLRSAMRAEGLEPPRAFAHRLLRPACLPISPRPRVDQASVGYYDLASTSPGAQIGKGSGLKNRRWKQLGGSSPPPGIRRFAAPAPVRAF